MRPKRRKPLRRGIDWHGWAWKTGSADFKPGQLFYFADATYPWWKPTRSGKWVKVKFVEVT